MYRNSLVAKLWVKPCLNVRASEAWVPVLTVMCTTLPSFVIWGSTNTVFRSLILWPFLTRRLLPPKWTKRVTGFWQPCKITVPLNDLPLRVPLQVKPEKQNKEIQSLTLKAHPARLSVYIRVKSSGVRQKGTVLVGLGEERLRKRKGR